MNYTIDATNKKLGRVASEAAKVLTGKTSPSYKPNAVTCPSVSIINASKADISTKKKNEKKYTRYSGHPGGLKIATMEDVINKKGYAEIFKVAVKGMLPKTKLQKEMMKKLTIKE